MYYKIAKSENLQYFLEKSFSLELLLLLYSMNKFEGIENIYQILYKYINMFSNY